MDGSLHKAMDFVEKFLGKYLTVSKENQGLRVLQLFHYFIELVEYIVTYAPP